MSATAKTFGALGLALLGLVIFLSIFLSKVFLGGILLPVGLYLGLALFVVFFISLIYLTAASDAA